MKKTFAILMIAMMIMCFMPTAAFADEVEGEKDPLGEHVSEHAAAIGETLYATLDEAVAAAKDGDTINLLKDCSTAGLNLSKNLTIDGKAAEGDSVNKTVTFSDKGIALWGKSLTFENCKVNMTGIGSTPYTAEWDWMAICAKENASLTLNDTTMTLDGTDAGNAHAIYFCSNNKLNLNNSTLTIKNYPQDALEWNGGDGGYNINMVNSTFISDHNRSGFTGTFYATIDNSKADVINSTGNGSNGSNFHIKNGSEVNFNNNGAHGLSVGILIIENSTVNAIGNGANGIYIGTEGKFEKGSRVTVNNNECKIGSKWTKPGAIYVGESLYVSDEDVKLEIIGNKNCGVYVKKGASANIKTGVIKTNINEVEFVHDAKGTEVQNDRTGGGIFNDGGTVALGEKVQLYNNHAAAAGDDIYNSKDAVITFGKVGTGWKLDGTPDCKDNITGWFEDGTPSEDKVGVRWEAHEKPLHIEELKNFNDAGFAEVQGIMALKAAHGKISPYIPPVVYYYTVTYNDGVEGEEVFPDQINRLLSYNTITPAFSGTPEREGYIFKGWTPLVAERVTADAYYQALWEKSEEPLQPTEPTEQDYPQKPQKPAKPEKPTKPDNPNKPEGQKEIVPKTGDMSFEIMALSVFMMAVSSAFMMLLLFKKKASTRK